MLASLKMNGRSQSRQVLPPLKSRQSSEVNQVKAEVSFSTPSLTPQPLLPSATLYSVCDEGGGESVGGGREEHGEN